MESDNSLILSDIDNAFLDLSGVTCENIDYLCMNFGKSQNPMPDFTLLFQGTEEPPWCKQIECRGKEVDYMAN